jgi:hypothetical protein
MKKWTDEEIGKALLELSKDGRLPSNDDLSKLGMSGLGFAVTKTGGYPFWAQKLGLKTKSDRFMWTEEAVKEALLVESQRFGRMPSANELRDVGCNSLACAVVRRGGFRVWAKRLGLEQKGTETHRGQKWERQEAVYFRSIGFEVEEQLTRASFDLLVNGKRVDVKSSSFNDRGWYQFGSIKCGSDCDFFDLVCVGNNKFLARFIIPSSIVKIKTISMMPNTLRGIGKYAAFRNAVYYLK